MPARLKTSIWVDAFLRQASINGHFGAVLHKGADEAGSVVLVVNHLDGNHDLLTPPPGPAYDAQGDRCFVKANKNSLTWPEASERLDKWRSQDPDMWVVEVEDRVGLAGAKLVVE